MHAREAALRVLRWLIVHGILIPIAYSMVAIAMLLAWMLAMGIDPR